MTRDEEWVEEEDISGMSVEVQLQLIQITLVIHYN